MITVPGYKLIEKIYDSSRTVVYRGHREVDGKPVVIKLLRTAYPTFAELVQFRNQYTIVNNLDLPGIVQFYSLDTYQNRFILVMEDFGGIALEDYAVSWGQQQLGSTSESITEFLRIAIALAATLGGLCSHRIIHKDIKPTNILINPTTKEVKLIDFSIASLLPRETPTLSSPNVLEGTLAYLSPEQTGRMNRGIDYRTDFYSLGITFFELLTGQLPFQAQDPLELVHCHIAKQPPSIHSLNPTIPSTLAAIVSQLMAKNAEDRYQSPLGLQHDLETCLHQWRETGKIIPFPLGQQDFSDRFSIPEKIYGREQEAEALMAAFDRVSDAKQQDQQSALDLSPDLQHLPTSELMLVAGFSGIGKTAVVNEVHKPIVQHRGYFVRGKFDQFQRNIPFSAFVQAFQDLAGQLLTESDAQVERWKLKILRALGENAQVIIDVIPELENIIGQQPPAPELIGVAAQNRFNLLFQKFIRVFTAQDHPLVIFLDDLQWADSASLKLMQLVMSDLESHYLLLIGAFRDNEVSAAHPLMLSVEEIRQAGVTVNAIALSPLQLADLNHLVADTLNCTLEQAIDLTQLVYQKTKGNPFFSTQFLKSLHEEGLISFNYQRGYWQYDLAQIKAISLTDDVVEFMGLQLQKLPPETQRVLKLAACIGNQFDLATLSVVYEQPPSETATALWKALQEGLILPIGEGYKILQMDESHEVASTEKQATLLDSELEAQSKLDAKNSTVCSISYRFLHDRVQQAAYCLIPNSEKQSTHLKIGQLLLSTTSAVEREEKIFEIVNQLNAGSQLITHPLQRNELAQLNLIAGRKARNSTAYTDACKYLALGLDLLPADCWHQYDLALTLHEEAAEAAYLSGKFDWMEQLAEAILQHAKTLLDQVKINQVKIEAYKAQNKRLEAVKAGLNVLKLLGVEFPEKPSSTDIAQGMAEITSNLAGKGIGTLIHLPQMTDPYKLSAMRILSSMNSAAYFAAPELFPLLVFKQVSVSILHGNAPESAFAYACYGISLCGAVGDVETGYQFGQLASSLLEQFDAEAIKAVTGYVVNVMIRHWQEPIRETLPSLLIVYQSGLDTGDLEHAAFAAGMYCYHSYCVGKELTGLKQEMAAYSDMIRQLRQETSLYQQQLYQQIVLNLTGATENPGVFRGEAYDEQIMLPLHQQANDRSTICIFYIHKIFLCYLFQDYAQALENSVLAEQYLDAVTSKIDVPLFYFYDSLTRLAIYSNANSSEQQCLLEKIAANQEKMHNWAIQSPANYGHKFYLVEAERYRVLGQNVEAMEHYDRAIAEAEKNGYINETALAYELAAAFYLAWNKRKVAQVYLTDAYYSYVHWGAAAKVQQLESCYSELLTPILNSEKINLKSDTITPTTSRALLSNTTNVSKALDLTAIVKASQALSGKIQLEKLLFTLIRILAENAGAEKCVVLLPQNENWIIVAQENESAETSLLQTLPLKSSKTVPQSVINYVSRTSETLVMDDARTEAPFTTDAYILEQQPKSVLCTPICHQSKLIGILYLENNLTTGAFTRDRLEVLKLLTAQAAISLQNALLYNTLEQKVQQRTQELNQKNQHLSETLVQLQHTQTQLIQTEKMSSLGQMVAGVAHEINNPINFIHGNIVHANDYCQSLLDLVEKYQQYYPSPASELQNQLKDIDFEFLKEDLQKLLQSMRVGADRIRQIVLSLRNFSRLDEAEMKPVNIHEGIDSTLLILQHRLKEKSSRPSIEVIKEYGQLPQVACYASQLNQVFMNILSNAIDALESDSQNQQPNFAPCIQIRTELTTSNRITIWITDNGLGMSEKVKRQLFDPFFTTKPVGKGTGLGLSISYSIVEKHGGHLSVRSESGRGAEFKIDIPLIHPSVEQNCSPD